MHPSYKNFKSFKIKLLNVKFSLRLKPVFIQIINFFNYFSFNDVFIMCSEISDLKLLKVKAFYLSKEYLVSETV